MEYELCGEAIAEAASLAQVLLPTPASSTTVSTMLATGSLGVDH